MDKLDMLSAKITMIFIFFWGVLFEFPFERCLIFVKILWVLFALPSSIITIYFFFEKIFNYFKNKKKEVVSWTKLCIMIVLDSLIFMFVFYHPFLVLHGLI